MTLLFASILFFYGELDDEDEDESGDGDSFHLGLATFLGGLRDRPTTFLGGLATFLGGLRGGLATFLGGLRGGLANLRVIFGYDGKEGKEEKEEDEDDDGDDGGEGQRIFCGAFKGGVISLGGATISLLLKGDAEDEEDEDGTLSISGGATICLLGITLRWYEGDDEEDKGDGSFGATIPLLGITLRWYEDEEEDKEDKGDGTLSISGGATICFLGITLIWYEGDDEEDKGVSIFCKGLGEITLGGVIFAFLVLGAFCVALLTHRPFAFLV